LNKTVYENNGYINYLHIIYIFFLLEINAIKVNGDWAYCLMEICFWVIQTGLECHKVKIN